MKINYIKVRGAIGFKKGLGVDEVEFNLTSKTGLVALSGPNGRGKTTLLELMSPYRTFASRKGALRHHFFLRDSFIETKFVYNNQEFHTIRKIDSGSDRAEAFIVVDGESVVNGKLREYDDYIVNLFGSETLFYNSVFCAQNSGNISDMRTGEIKELFVEFLRIERLVEFETKAKHGISFFQKKLDILSGQIEVCQESISFLGNIEDDIEKNQTRIVDVERDIELTDEGIKRTTAELEELKRKEIEQKNDIDRKKELEENLEKLVVEQDEIKTKTDNLNIFLCQKHEVLTASIKIKEYQGQERHFSECFECSIDEQGRLDKEIKRLAREKEVRENRIEYHKNDLVLDGLKTTLSWLESQSKFFETNLNTVDLIIEGLAKSVCECDKKIAMAIDPDCKSIICPALNIVSEAKKELPALKKDMVDMETKRLDGNDKLNLLSKKIGSCRQGLEVSTKDINSKVDILQEEIEGFEDARKLAMAKWIDIDDFKSFYKSRRLECREKIQGLEELAGKKLQITIAEGKYLQLSEQFKNLKKTIVFERAKISDIKIIDSIDFELRLKISEEDQATKNKKKLSDSLNRLNESAAVFKNELDKKNNTIISLKEKKSQEKIYLKELSEWDYLRLACSKTGLQALEIDGAAPLIVSEANTLLEKAFGLDSQIRIVTQDPETGREVFQIKVIRDDGSEDDFSNLSGGQKVWIAKALSLGMTLVSKRKSGRDFMTLFADEEDGALDSEKALDFIQLYRSMMATGDFNTCFFISHNPDVVAMSDHEIKF
jgi:DNA repair protein SbcC/Rad50